MAESFLPLSIPSPPSLSPPTGTTTNTLALLLPHLSLFAPPVLALLRQHYEQFGPIAHWAPVKGFGRAIVVWEKEDDATRAKREGDYLTLDVDIPKESDVANPSIQQQDTGEETRVKGSRGGEEYFSSSQGRRKSRSSKGLILRLHPLPPTLLHPDPATLHLAPPPLPHNFLISPPGSPPEGWEPILEDAPNSSTLAEDLQRALEALQLNGGGRRTDGKEVILDEGGMRVEVEDTTRTDVEFGEVQEWGEERLDRGDEAWVLPGHGIGMSAGVGMSTSGLGSGIGTPIPGGTPGYKIKIQPTAMPPL